VNEIALSPELCWAWDDDAGRLLLTFLHQLRALGEVIATEVAVELEAMTCRVLLEPETIIESVEQSGREEEPVYMHTDFFWRDLAIRSLS
jgi:hypothetical protein